MAGKKAKGEKRNRLEVLKSGLFRWIIFGQLLVLFLIAYVKIGSLLIAQTNHTDKNMFGGDQMHNMRLATWAKPDQKPDFSQGFSEALANFFPHQTDGVVQPLWPWVAAWFAKPGYTITEENMLSRQGRPEDYAFFNRGRWFNVFFTATFLIFLGIAACRLLSFPAALNLLLLGGFGALLPRAAYFQPEPLYFVFFFLTWVACLCALKKNSLWIYGVIGVVSGLAYMTKGSVHPLLAGFIVASSVRCIWEIFSSARHHLQINPTYHWHWRNHVMGLIVLGLAHFLTIGPRLTTSYEKFGSMFHSYTSYWMWMDDFDNTGFQWMVDHPNKQTLTSIPKDQKPSLGNYLKTHTPEQVQERLVTGTRAKLDEFLLPNQTKRSDKIEKQKPWRGIFEWRGWYLAYLVGVLILILAAIPFAAGKAEHLGHVIFKPGTGSIIFFVVGSFVGFSLLYGWYHPIGRGDRFMMSLYLPLVFSLIWGADAIVKQLQKRQCATWLTQAYLFTHWVLFSALCWRLYEILRTPYFYNR